MHFLHLILLLPGQSDLKRLDFDMVAISSTSSFAMAVAMVSGYCHGYCQAPFVPQAMSNYCAGRG